MKFGKSSLLALLFALAAGRLASAGYIGPDRSVTTTTWERQYCSYRATVASPAGSCDLTLYFSPGSCPSPASVAGYFNNAATACGTSWPGSCGSGLSCSITLLTGSTESCSSGETGCTQTTHTTTYPPATVSGTTACTLPGNAGWCRGTAVLDLSGNEPLAPAYSLTLFEGSLGPLCSAPACAWTFPEGTTSLDFWVHSTYGDTSAMSSASMRVDSLPPTLTLSLPPADGLEGWFVSGPVTASASAVDATSGVEGVSINDGGSTFTASLDGLYALRVLASDHAGNTAAASATIRLDTTPPDLSVSLPPPDGSHGWYLSPVTLAGAGADATSGLAFVRFRLDGGAWVEGTEVTVSDGVHLVEFQAGDLAGNLAAENHTISVDSTPPQSAFTAPAEGSTTVIHGIFPLAGQTLDLDSGPGAAGISIDGGVTWQPLALSDGTWSTTWDTHTVPDGTYTLLVRASDLAGNQEHTARVTLVVANTGPEVRITETWWLWEQAGISIRGGLLPVTGAQISVSDGLGQKRTYTYDAGSLPASFRWDGTWEDGHPAPPGSYTVVVTAWDAFGSTGQDAGTVRVPRPLPTPTRTLPAATAGPSGTPLPALSASPPPGGLTPAPGPAAPQAPPRPPVIDPILLWPVIGLLGLLAALASSSWADPRPAALQRLEKALLSAASRSEDTRN